jgi:hypothetical protein
MRKLSLVAGMLGCLSLLLLSPGVASAGIIASISIDDFTSETPSTTASGFNSGTFSASNSMLNGNEFVQFAGTYTAAANAASTASITAVVVLTEPGSSTQISDILSITFSQTLHSNLISINGTFTSTGDGGSPLDFPPNFSQIEENGKLQDVSGMLQDQGFRSDIQVQIGSDTQRSSVIPEPASMIVWSFIACGIAVPGLRRRWRAAAKTA